MVGGRGAAPTAAAKSGCNHRKGDQALAVDAALAELYPSRRWEPPAAADAPDALLADAAGLADELADVLVRRRPSSRPPDADTPCAFIYVLCAGRPAVRRAGPRRRDDNRRPSGWQSPGRLTERYLRVALAPARALRGGPGDRGRRRGRPRRRAGPRGDATGGLLGAALGPVPEDRGHPARLRPHPPGSRRARRDPPPGFTAGDWPARFAGAPGVVNFLFFPEPATLTATTWIPREAA
jgi:hypothetical protein